MRALQLTAYDGPEGLALADTPRPIAGEDEVLLRVEAIGINFPDLLATQGLYQHKPPLPFVPGCEIAGVVVEAAPGSGWQSGDRAAAFVWNGGYAELAAVPTNALMPVPDEMSSDTAAALVVNYHTVHFALARRGALQPGESALVLGAGGGIGSAAVQVAKGLGARVIAGTADEEQAKTAAAAGADETVLLREGFSAAIRDMTDGRGVDVVLDPLGDWLFDEGLRALAPEGRILIVGFAAGAIPEIKANRLLLRNATAAGVAWGAFLDVEPSLMRTTAESLNEMARQGTVAPPIARRFGFEEIPSALTELSRGAIRGKAIATFS